MLAKITDISIACDACIDEDISMNSTIINIKAGNLFAIYEYLQDKVLLYKLIADYNKTLLLKLTEHIDYELYVSECEEYIMRESKGYFNPYIVKKEILEVLNNNK